MSLEMQFFSWMMNSKRRNGTDTDLKRLQEEFEAEFSRPKVRIRPLFLIISGEVMYLSTRMLQDRYLWRLQL